MELGHHRPAVVEIDADDDPHTRLVEPTVHCSAHALDTADVSTAATTAGSFDPRMEATTGDVHGACDSATRSASGTIRSCSRSGSLSLHVDVDRCVGAGGEGAARDLGAAA